MIRQSTAAAFLLLAFLTLRTAGAAWQPSADNKLTEDQIKAYLATTNDWLDEYARIMQDLEAAKTEDARLAAVADIGKRHDACLTSHNMSSEEYNWIGQRTMEAWSVAAYNEDVYTKAESDIQMRLKENDAKLADAKRRLADYQAAQKDGKRILTPEDRNAAIKSAASDQQSAADEARQHADEARTALEEAKQQEASAAAADALVASPPADVSGDDRPSYIEGKKGEAQSARDAAREARDRAAEATKGMNDAQAKAALGAARAVHPEIPLTDDEKAQIKSENDAAIAQAKTDINQCDQTKTQIAVIEAELKKQADETAKSAPPENVVLMQKYAAEYKKAFERLALGGANTQPSGK